MSGVKPDAALRLQKLVMLYKRGRRPRTDENRAMLLVCNNPEKDASGLTELYKQVYGEYNGAAPEESRMNAILERWKLNEDNERERVTEECVQEAVKVAEVLDADSGKFPELGADRNRKALILLLLTELSDMVQEAEVSDHILAMDFISASECLDSIVKWFFIPEELERHLRTERKEPRQKHPPRQQDGRIKREENAALRELVLGFQPFRDTSVYAENRIIVLAFGNLEKDAAGIADLYNQCYVRNGDNLLPPRYVSGVFERWGLSCEEERQNVFSTAAKNAKLISRIIDGSTNPLPVLADNWQKKMIVLLMLTEHFTVLRQRDIRDRIFHMGYSTGAQCLDNIFELIKGFQSKDPCMHKPAPADETASRPAHHAPKFPTETQEPGNTAGQDDIALNNAERVSGVSVYQNGADVPDDTGQGAGAYDRLSFLESAYTQAQHQITRLQTALNQKTRQLGDLQQEFDERLDENIQEEKENLISMLNSDQYGCILDLLITARNGFHRMRREEKPIPLELRSAQTLVRRMLKFVEDCGITPIRETGDILNIKADQAYEFQFEGSPFKNAEELKKVEIVSPGWQAVDKALVISKPRVREVPLEDGMDE